MSGFPVLGPGNPGNREKFQKPTPPGALTFQLGLLNTKVAKSGNLKIVGSGIFHLWYDAIEKRPVDGFENPGKRPGNRWSQNRVVTHVLYLLLPQKSISAIRFELGGAWAEIGSGGSAAISGKVGNFFSPDLNQIFRVGRDTPQTMEYEKFFPKNKTGAGPGDRKGTLREKCCEPWRPNGRS